MTKDRSWPHFWAYEETEQDNCAGMKIEKAVVMFSDVLLEGSKHFAELAANSSSDKEIIFYNTSCILNGISAIEATLNETISVFSVIGDGGPAPQSFWLDLQKNLKNLTIKDKWDSIAAIHKGQLWDAGKKPFQSFETINSLRNELVHYKGTLLAANTAPNNRLNDLMTKFNIVTKSSFVEDDASSWVIDILQCKEIGEWVYNEIESFQVNSRTLLMG